MTTISILTSPVVTSGALIMAAMSLLGLLINKIGPWRRQVTEEEAVFRADLRAENEALKARIGKVERLLRRRETIHNAERALDRNKIANLQSCFDATMMLLEMNPTRTIDVVAKIKEMRDAQIVAEATEMAIIRAAEITAGDEEDDDTPASPFLPVQPGGAAAVAGRAVTAAQRTVTAAVATVNEIEAGEGK